MSKILVADDEMGIRDIIKQYLEFDSFECDEATNGQEAVEKAKKCEYDLIIMDVMMPFLDGIAALREIRKFSLVPIVMLTAKAEEYDKILGFEFGADDYVVKPF
ncbi:MAG: response regulator, partial [Oscillospiraceae bacterium]